MKFAYGEDWENLFDLCSVYAAKPLFFSLENKIPFVFIDREKETEGEEAQELVLTPFVERGGEGEERGEKKSRPVYCSGNITKLKDVLGPGYFLLLLLLLFYFILFYFILFYYFNFQKKRNMNVREYTFALHNILKLQK